MNFSRPTEECRQQQKQQWTTATSRIRGAIAVGPTCYCKPCNKQMTIYHKATKQGSEGCQAFANPTPMTTIAQSTTSATLTAAAASVAAASRGAMAVGAQLATADPAAKSRSA